MSDKGRWRNQCANFKVTFSRDTFESIRESANRTGKGFHRAIKDYLMLNVFPYMTHGDYTFIREVRFIGKTSIEIHLHLNDRLLNKANERAV